MLMVQNRRSKYAMVIQPAMQIKSTIVAEQNLVLPRGLDLWRCPVSRELEHKNGLIPSYAR